MAKRIKCPKCKGTEFSVIDISDVKEGEVILICEDCGEEFSKQNEVKNNEVVEDGRMENANKTIERTDKQNKE